MSKGAGPRGPRVVEKAKDAKKALLNLAKYCKKYWVGVLIAVLCTVVGTVLSVLGPNKISEISNLISVKLYGIDIDLLAVTNVATTLAIMYASSMILTYIENYIMATISCKVSKQLRTDISCKINKLPLNYFDKHSNGDTLSRVTNDVDSISQSLNQSVGMLIAAITMLLGCLIMMFVTQWIMALCAIGSSILGFILTAIIMSKSQKYFNERQNNLADVNSHVEEYFAGQNIVRVYNAEERAHKDFTNKNEKLRKSTFKAEFLSGFMHPIMNFIGNLGYVVVCIVGSALAFEGSINFSVVIAFMIYIRMFTSPLGQIAQGMSGIQQAAAASERVFELLDEKELEEESAKTKKIKNVKGNVSIKNACFGYDENRVIINDFSIDIKAGQKVAIVGPTGAGKTTIVNLLMRFYELNSGSISVDNVCLKDIKRENVHDIFGMVLQDTWIFEGTIRDNLLYGKKMDDESLLKICEEVGLSHFIKTLPNGLDTVLNESVTMSAGQKQLLTIARAFIENAPMLIFDEATSSVDTRTEIQIQRAMDKLTKGRTSFIIAHRLSTIKDADIIIYMEDGDIKETGNHKKLLAKNGKYADLYNSQFMPA